MMATLAFKELNSTDVLKLLITKVTIFYVVDYFYCRLSDTRVILLNYRQLADIVNEILILFDR